MAVQEMPIKDSISQRTLASLIGHVIFGRPSDDDSHPPGRLGPIVRKALERVLWALGDPIPWLTPRRRAAMTPMQCVKGVGAATAIGVLVGVVISSGRARAEDNALNGLADARVSQGFKIAPVRLNLAGKDKALVGLGSYLVNATGNCNVCHSMGPPGPPTEFTPTGNPYLLTFDGHTKTNPATYLGGGRDFGPFPGPDSPVHIVSRNLTPDKTGLPLGGAKLSEFLHIMKTGEDTDHLHPSLPFLPPPPPPIPPPPSFNGAVLQIMPWPIYQNMTDRDLRAIYEYLSAIPCIAGPDAPNPLHHNC